MTRRTMLGGLAVALCRSQDHVLFGAIGCGLYGRTTDLEYGHIHGHNMIMTRVNLAQAKANLSKYLEAARGGETVIICNRNVPVAELRPLPQQSRRARPIGLAKGSFRVPPSFFDPLPADILAAFRGDEGQSV